MKGIFLVFIIFISLTFNSCNTELREMYPTEDVFVTLITQPLKAEKISYYMAALDFDLEEMRGKGYKTFFVEYEKGLITKVNFFFKKDSSNKELKEDLIKFRDVYLQKDKETKIFYSWIKEFEIKNKKSLKEKEFKKVQKGLSW